SGERPALPAGPLPLAPPRGRPRELRRERIGVGRPARAAAVLLAHPDPAAAGEAGRAGLRPSRVRTRAARDPPLREPRPRRAPLRAERDAPLRPRLLLLARDGALR